MDYVVGIWLGFQLFSNNNPRKWRRLTSLTWASCHSEHNFRNENASGDCALTPQTCLLTKGEEEGADLTNLLARNEVKACTPWGVTIGPHRHILQSQIFTKRGKFVTRMQPDLTWVKK